MKTVEEIATGPNAERDEEMRRLRTEDGWSLQRIANKFGVSRQRVAQIIGNTGHLAKEKLEKRILEMPLTMKNSEVARKLGIGYRTVQRIRSGLAVRPEGSWSANGKYNAKLVIQQQLEEMGFEYEMFGSRADCDFIINGYRVRVNSRRTPKKISPSIKERTDSPSPRYTFTVGKTENSLSRDIDFQILLIVDKGDVFVVPYDEIPEGQAQIIFCWPTQRPELGKYQKYHERWDLLQGG